jgi:hypothetical protein
LPSGRRESGQHAGLEGCQVLVRQSSAAQRDRVEKDQAGDPVWAGGGGQLGHLCPHALANQQHGRSQRVEGRGKVRGVSGKGERARFVGPAARTGQVYGQRVVALPGQQSDGVPGHGVVEESVDEDDAHVTYLPKPPSSRSPASSRYRW